MLMGSFVFVCISDVSRDLSEGLSLAWSSNATEAEKALENLTCSEKLFRIDKGRRQCVQLYRLVQFCNGTMHTFTLAFYKLSNYFLIINSVFVQIR